MVFSSSAKLSAKLGVDFLKQISEFMCKTKGHDRVLQKLQVIGGGDGKCLAEFTIGPEDVNRGGALHGGLTATIIDNVTTYALMTQSSPPGVSVDLQVSYVSPAKEGDRVLVDATTIRAGKSLAYIECELRQKESGRVIAKGGQTKYVG